MNYLIEDIRLNAGIYQLDESKMSELKDIILLSIKKHNIISGIKKSLTDSKSIERSFLRQIEKAYKTNGEAGALELVKARKDKANATAKKLEHFFFKNYIGSTILNVSFVRVIASPLMDIIMSHLTFLPKDNPMLVAIAFSFIFDNVFRVRYKMETEITKVIKKRNIAFNTVRKNIEVM